MSIQDELAAVQAQGGQGALDQWLATTQYTPAELHQATGYNVSDIQSAINAAQISVNPYDYANDNLQAQGIAEKWSPDYAATQDDLYSMRQMMAQQGAGWMSDSMSNGASTYAYLPGLASERGVAITPGMSDAYQRATGSAYQPVTQITGFDPANGKYELGSVTPAATPAPSLDSLNIDRQLQAVQAEGGQAALDRWLATSSYSPAQMSLATGYTESDIARAIANAKLSTAQPSLSSSFVLGGAQPAPGVAPYNPSTPGIGASTGVQRPPEQAPAAPQPAPGGLTQIATAIQTPITSPGINTPPSMPTSNAVSDQDIKSWFTYNPGWTPETLKTYMASYGITPEQMARATGNLPEVMIERYNRVGRQAPQAGAQTGYVDYTQPIAPIAEGAGSGNLPYYYNTSAGQVGSYLPSSYWRGNVQSYGGMAKHVTGQATPTAPRPAPAPIPVTTYVPPPPAPAPTPAQNVNQTVSTQADFDKWYADYMRRQALLDRGFGTGSGSDGIGGDSGTGDSSDGPSDSA